VVLLELSATDVGESEQAGGSVTLEAVGEVSAQVSEAVPLYPSVVVTVTVEVAAVPGATAEVVLALRVKVPVAAPEVTVTDPVPVAPA